MFINVHISRLTALLLVMVTAVACSDSEADLTGSSQKFDYWEQEESEYAWQDGEGYHSDQSGYSEYSDDDNSWGNYEDSYYDDDSWGDDNDDAYYDDHSWGDDNDDAYYDDHSDQYEGAADEFLAMDIGNVVVSVSYSSPTAVLSCARGSIAVSAGALAGSQLGIAVGSTSVVTGPGAIAIAPTAIASFAVIGGAVGLAGSIGDWVSCANSLAYIGIQLFTNHRTQFMAPIAEMQAVVSQALSRPLARPGTNAQTRQCQSHLCGRMTERYHNQYCDPMEKDGIKRIYDRWNDRMCANADVFFSYFNCDELYRFVNLAAGCAEGRKTVSQRCFNNTMDAEHQRQYNNAVNQLNDCTSLYRRSCGEISSPQQSRQQMQSEYPECR